MSIDNSKRNISTIGEANPLRGASYHKAAVSFIHKFPVGTELSVTEFDSFCVARGVNRSPVDSATGSDAWQAFLQRRHQAKNNINKAGSHSRMLDEPLCQAFSIVQQGQGRLVVKSALEAAVTTQTAKQIESLVSSKKVALRHLLQSVDFAALAPAQQAQVQNLYDNIEDYEYQVRGSSERLNQKFDRLRIGFKTLIELGTIKPQNGALNELVGLENSSNQNDVDDMDDMDENIRQQA